MEESKETGSREEDEGARIAKAKSKVLREGEEGKMKEEEEEKEAERGEKRGVGD